MRAGSELRAIPLLLATSCVLEYPFQETFRAVFVVTTVVFPLESAQLRA
jgi:hypothetical protein